AQYSQAGPGYPYFEITLSKNEMENIIPPDFALRQNYPNPFNPSTTITYALPKSGKVRLDIYNLKGQLVNTLVNQDMEAGVHSVVWNGTDKNKRAVASGVYFYRLSSPESSKTKRMLLMK
ncbi:MAG: T9SS type A sorting domain-containing protein, partial [Candidatus Cloacimonetes bacterium]|nr:T9SS type A sorting domain-containing protein [Candidatus Cloacimonadota bacterium]